MNNGMSNFRWINRVHESLQLILTGQKVFQTPICEKTRAILMKYEKKLEQPFRAIYSAQKSRVFANNYMNLGDINVIGFDLDYTLVPYTAELQHLIFTMARDTLVSSYDYPIELKTCFFDPQFAIRGLSVDSRYGVLVKLNYLQRIQRRYCYKGKRQLTKEELQEGYGASRHISFENLSTMRPLNDLFSMAEACLIADAIDVFEHRKSTKGEQYSPTAIVDDVQAAIRDVHVSGAMHNTVIHEFDRYSSYNPRLLELLLHFKRAGKKLFLCTNSGYRYADRALAYAMGLPTSSSAETSDWKELFDLIICSSNKPSFFTSKKPFRKWNTEFDRPLPSPVDKLHPKDVFINGSVQALHKLTNWSDSEILYIGDNLGADLVQAKKIFGWHTAGIINELDREIEIQSEPLFHELHYIRSSLRAMLTDLQLAMFSSASETPDHFSSSSSPLSPSSPSPLPSTESPPTLQALAHYLSYANNAENRELIQLLEDELHAVNTELSLLFNPQFGSMFRTDGHTSLYAYAIRRYADLYMSEVTHFLHYSPNHRFYPPHALHMAHDPVFS